MGYIIVILALILVAKPILTGIWRIFYVIFSGTFNAIGKVFFLMLAFAGIVAVFCTGPVGWVIGLIVFIFFKAIRSKA